MTEEIQKLVGRLLTGRIQGQSIDDQTKKLMSSGIISGVTLFKDNIESIEQTAQLIADIKSLCVHKAIVAVDQEGGAVQRFDHIVSPMPSPMSLASAASIETLSLITTHSAKELSSLGINLVLAPVVDIVSNPENEIVCTRSFGSDLELIATYAKKQIDIFTKWGLISSLKHFPGHGPTSEDSHLKLAINNHDLDTLLNTDLKPFIDCLSIAPSILVGHIWLPAIDKEPLPASLSQNVVKSILRRKLTYSGLVITDDMLMKAITDQWGLEEACIMSLEAGCDLLLVCGSAEQSQSVHEAICKAVESKRLTLAKIEKSVERVEKALQIANSKSMKMSDRLAQLKTATTVGKHIALAASKSSIAQIKGSLPELTENTVVLMPEHHRYSLDLAGYLQKHFPSIEAMRYSLKPSSTECQSIKAKVEGKNCILLSFRSHNNLEQAELGKAVRQAARQATLVCTDVPYDILLFSEFENVLATFDPSDLAMEALAEIIAKKVEPSGINPVNMNVAEPVLT